MRNRHKEILLITGEWDACIQREEFVLAHLNCKVKAGWGLGLLSSHTAAGSGSQNKALGWFTEK